MNKTWLIILAGLILFSSGWGQVIFTGDASADFGEGTVWAMDNNGEGDVNITNQMQSAGVLSGWDFIRIGFNYDWDNDIMYIGIDDNGRICGDADGDGDPGAETYLTGNNSDIPDLGDGEVIAVWLDTDNSGGPNGWDVITGVPADEDYTGFGVFEAVGGWGNPNNSFGDPIATSSGSYLFANPSASQPDFECAITNFSQLPGFEQTDPLVSGVVFNVYAYSGSFVDGGVGYDKLIDCWVTITFPEPPNPNSITHYYPLDLYVMEGIPLQVEDGDPVNLFGYPFNAYPPGWPYWRVSRWNSELQTYERYEEENWPLPVGGNPPDQEPGLGFWVVQDIEIDPVIEIEGTFYGEGDQVTQPLQHPYSDGRRGLSQIANPFHIPITWGDAWIQLADQSEPPMSVEDASDDGIICRYAISWDTYNLQYLTNDLDAALDVWRGFWVEQYDLDEEYLIGFDFPATDNTTVARKAGSTPPFGKDDYLQWSFSLGIIVESLNLYDTQNFIGISPEAMDVFDRYDAPEFAPQVTEGGYVHLYFPHQDWQIHPGYYSYDFRSGPFTGERYWDFIVRSSDYAGAVIISWDGAAKAAPEYVIALLDDEGNVLVEDLTLSENISISIAADEEKEFSLRVTGLGSGVNGDNDASPAVFSLSNAYPNPFNNSSQIAFTLKETAWVKVQVYDVDGRLIKTFANGSFSAGNHTLKLDFSGFASGIYFLKANADGADFGAQKLVLMK